MKIRAIIFTFLLAGFFSGLSQGFMNLNFESANVSGNGPSSVSTTSALPYWTVLIPFIANNVPYNDIALDGQSVDLFGTNNQFGPSAIQGNYSVYIQGGSFADPDTNGASIMQTGQIPFSAQSIIYWGGALQVSFGGQALAFNAIGSGSGYTIWQADISAYAGQVGVLQFTKLWLPTNGSQGALLDNIQFSTSPVPEPSILGLSALGGLFLAMLARRRRVSA